MMSQPKKWWFLIPLPAALAVSYVLLLARVALSPKGLTGALQGAGVFAIGGVALFPVGLTGGLTSTRNLEDPFLVQVFCLGYALYLGMTIAGVLKPSKWLLAALCLILVLNVVGCQMPGIM
jgi:hypothetical protein